MMFFIATIFILAPLAAQDEAPAVFKTGVADVRVDVQVTEGKDLIRDLAKDDFVVRDEGQPQNIVSFEHGDERLNLLLLLDISGSMQKYIEQIAQTARQALGHLRPGDRVAIMVFARKTAIHQGFSDNLAETARQIGAAVKNWDVGSTTLINSAIVDAAHYMQQHAGPEGRRAILILTDNLSTSYQLTDGQVIRELDKADTVFNAIVTGHAIRPNPPGPSMFPNPDYTPANVFHLAEETGGEWTQVGQADQTFSNMIERIRTRYMLAYHAPPAQPGAFRRIGVSLSPEAKKKYPSAELRARSGYYAQ
ncbi:MAG TPA: VWA domain-containing protein [Bryobacteraceae bacterium]|nr:VWA domain-containing protein [Bryobacteraceae bacterium]